jgi:hypothetical protein
MILVKEKPVKNGIKKIGRIYINTLVPNFEFRNKQGALIKQQKYCIDL